MATTKIPSEPYDSEDAELEEDQHLEGAPKKQSMAEAVGEFRKRLHEPPASRDLIESYQKITDFSPSAGRYAKQKRFTLTLRCGHDVVFKETVSAYQIVTHRDQYIATDAADRKLRVESDETSIILIATKHDIHNAIGRAARKRGEPSISTLEETLTRVLATGVKVKDSEDPGGQ